MKLPFALIFTALFLLVAAPLALHAHQTSDSYLTLEFSETNITGQWDMAVKDLDLVVSLDDNRDGETSEEELHAHEKDIAQYALAHLAAKIDNVPRQVQVVEQTVAFHLSGPYVELHLQMDGAAEGKELELTSTLFFEQHPQHNGMFLLDYQGQKQASVFTENKTRQTFLLVPLHEKFSLWAQLRTFIIQGIWHIWRGYDHILFLIALLLPSVLKRTGREWIAVKSFHPALVNVLKIVTAFTLAHSITLSLATLNIIRLPVRLTESAIALSVLLAALNNVFPLCTRREWLVAFGFGLIHGFGFASALSEMGFDRGNLALTLVGFNLGVEAGQLAVVAIFLPASFIARKKAWYQACALRGGSCLIVVVSACWLADRVFNLNFMPF